MILKTEEFQEAANKILFAAGLDQNAANLELVVKNSFLYLNVTNKEYYVSVKFAVDTTEELRAVVDAATFLNLISGISTETFEFSVSGNTCLVKAGGKSAYKIAMIYENDDLLVLPTITLTTPTVEMAVDNDILKSILNVNSKEIQKAKKLSINEIQKLYYVDETGCFTFTTGACLNRFSLEKPIKLLLNERAVKLFKLFTEDKVNLSFGYEAEGPFAPRPKLVLQTPFVYIALRLSCDDALLHKIQGPCEASKKLVSEPYTNTLVFSSAIMSAAISRIILFTKNTVKDSSGSVIIGTFTFNNDEITIVDERGNIESVSTENGTNVDPAYSMRINLMDLKAVLDSCKNEHLTMNCGNHRSVVLNHGTISNLIPEYRAKENE